MDVSRPMIPAPSIPRSATPVVAVALVLVAALGGYFGYSHATPPPGGDASSSVAPTVAAKAATAIPDSAPAAAVPDEAFIRRIAREEAEAALHPKHAAPPADADDDTPDDAPYAPASAGSQPAAASPSASAPYTPAPQNATQAPNG
jgi:hypothetical protein